MDCKILAVLPILLGGFAGSASAASYKFDFESIPDPQSLRTSLTLTNGPIQVTITRSSGTQFNIANVSGAPTTWESGFLSPFFNETVFDYFIFNVNVPFSAVTAEAGDSNFDSDDIDLKLYDQTSGNGNLVGSDSQTRALGTQFNIATLLSAPAASAAESFTIQGIGSTGHSVFYDNIVVTTDDQHTPSSVPGPFPILGAVAAFRWSRKLRKLNRNSVTNP
jgi:hypothetical protein